MIRFIENHWVVLTAAILIAITTLSLSPVAELPPVPGTDKLHHFIAYGLLMLPTALRKPKKWLLIGLVFIMYSGAIELIQPYVNRYGEWLDLLANTGGLACGIIVAGLINVVAAKGQMPLSNNNNQQ
jgi:VanZ family protein